MAREMFQIKGRLAHRAASPADVYFLRDALGFQDFRVRLIAASIIIAEGVPELSDTAYAVTSIAIRTNEFGGIFPQMLFWEAMTQASLDRVDTESLLDVVEALVEVPPELQINMTSVLRRIAQLGSARALRLLARFGQG